MIDQMADLTWRDEIPVSTRFDDPYFSIQNGLAETQHVFLDGNGLPARFRDGFHIAELGFGTGLNFLATLQAWNAPGQFHFTSFEAYPLTKSDLVRALAPFDLPDAAALTDQWHGPGTYQIGPATLTIIAGDARETLPNWPEKADAWFLDGFSPAKNPELWQPDLLNQVAKHTAPNGTAATYSAAGHVRRSLETAGFTVERTPGFATKRHMTQAKLP